MGTLARLGASLLALGFLAGQEAQAHGGKAHSAMIEGRIEAVSPTSLSVGTKSGPVSVTLDESTKIVRGSVPVGREALRVGVPVMVHGSKLPGGSVGAAEVTIHEESAPPPHHGEP